MKCIIKAESRGRIRVHAAVAGMSLAEADILEYYLRSQAGVKGVKVYERTCDAVIEYNGQRAGVIQALSKFSFSDEAAAALVPEHTSRKMNRDYQNRLAAMVARRYAKRWFLPHDIRVMISA